VFFGVVGMITAVMALRFNRGNLTLAIAGAGIGLAATILLFDAARIVLASRTGPMQVALSSSRPLAWIAFATVAASVAAAFFALR
jgi:hypothetical protein